MTLCNCIYFFFSLFCRRCRPWRPSACLWQAGDDASASRWVRYGDRQRSNHRRRQAGDDASASRWVSSGDRQRSNHRRCRSIVCTSSAGTPSPCGRSTVVRHQHRDPRGCRCFNPTAEAEKRRLSADAQAIGPPVQTRKQDERSRRRLQRCRQEPQEGGDSKAPGIKLAGSRCLGFGRYQRRQLHVPDEAGTGFDAGWHVHIFHSTAEYAACLREPAPNAARRQRSLCWRWCWC